MRVVFELAGAEAVGAIFVVTVLKIDERSMTCVHKGSERVFAIGDIRNATTVSGRPFSLRPYDPSVAAKNQRSVSI